MNKLIKASPANPTSTLIDAQDILFQATYIAEFLHRTICSTAELDDGFELSSTEAYGFANMLQNLIESIKKANTILEEYEREGEQ